MSNMCDTYVIQMWNSCDVKFIINILVTIDIAPVVFVVTDTATILGILYIFNNFNDNIIL